MRGAAMLGLVLGIGLLGACEKAKTPAEQAAEDARAVAMVEAAQNVKAPPVPLEPAPIALTEGDAQGLRGARCGLVPGGVPDGDPVVIATPARALVKLGERFVTLAADPGSPELALGLRTHYVGKTHALRLARSPGDGTAPGRDQLAWHGRAELRDAPGRVVWTGAGVLTCGG